MSEEQTPAVTPEEVPEEVYEAIPDSPVPRPDIQPGTPKKRGRKAYPRDAAGNIIRPDGTIGSKARTPSAIAKQMNESISDADAGKAIQGAFMLASVPLGPHWRLFPQEESEMGRCFGPIFRRYPEQVGDIITAMMIAPTAVAIVMPRLVVQKMKAAGQIEKGDERPTLLRIVAMLEAEKHLDVAREVRDSADYLKSTISGAVQASGEAAKAEVK